MASFVVIRRDLIGPQAELGETTKWRSRAVPSSSVGRDRREPSAPEWQANRSAELRGSTVATMERNPPMGARSAPDGGDNGERRATTSTSPCPFPGPIPGVALNVADHVLLADLAQGGGAAGAHLVQEPADNWRTSPPMRNDLLIEIEQPKATAWHRAVMISVAMGRRRLPGAYFPVTLFCSFCEQACCGTAKWRAFSHCR